MDEPKSVMVQEINELINKFFLKGNDGERAVIEHFRESGQAKACNCKSGNEGDLCNCKT
jgi:hypothetical protein